MTYSSDFNELSNLNGIQFHKLLGVFERIITILKNFEGNYDKTLNVTKLAEFLNIPHRYVHDIITFFLEVQDMFENTFRQYHLKSINRNKSVYLLSKKKIPQKIVLTLEQLKLLSDLIYSFKKIKRGSGFNLSKQGTSFHANLKSLYQNHPYLFESNGNGLIYPSSFGLKLGELIISYSMANKEIKKLYIDNYKIKVVKNE